MGNDMSMEQGKMLAEILRLQRWAGGDIVPADRIFGLLHGFESYLSQEGSRSISEETESEVLKLLRDYESEEQESINHVGVMSRLDAVGVKESDAATVMKLCCITGQFPNAIDKIGPFFDVARDPGPAFEDQWYGALHYMELIDCTEEVHENWHSVFSPCVPRVGEIIRPTRGSLMEVIGVSYRMHELTNTEGGKHVVLVPHVSLKVLEEDETDQDNAPEDDVDRDEDDIDDVDE